MPKKTTQPVRTRTESEYHTTLKYFQQWSEIIEEFPTFAQFLLAQKLSQATRIKHLRQAKFLCKRDNLSEGNELGKLTPAVAKPPIHFCDHNFESLYEAFADCRFSGLVVQNWYCVAS